MSTTTTTARPLVERPLRDHFKGDGLVTNGDGTISIYGWCAPWCARALYDGLGDHGRTVEDHGLWCQTTVGPAVPARYQDGTDERLGLELVRAYEHGVYPVPRTLRTEMVRLTVGAWQDDADERTELYMEPAAARSFAAALLYAADTLEGIDRPVLRSAEGAR
jgi:hypothetical protein